MKVNDATIAFAALAQTARLETLRALIRKGPTGLAAGAIADILDAPGPTVSFHLKELSRAGLVVSRREGRRVIYAADYGGVRGLVDFLMTDCCQGDRRLCGPYIIREPAA